MATITAAEVYETESTLEDAAAAEASTSAVSWSAIIAGAFAMGALSIALMALGAGLGLVSFSPWSSSWAAIKAVGVATAIWFIIAQWLSAALGGYLAGRLRTKWAGIHSDEVLFRDTAHGFLAWAVAAVASAAILISAMTLLGLGAASVASQRSQEGQETAAALGAPTDYYADMLFRSGNAAGAPPDQIVRTEAARILSVAVKNGQIAPADRAYLAQMVTARTGLAQPDAEKRVDEVFAQEKGEVTDSADKVRKGASSLAFATCLSMIVGAFIASVAAALGGHQRDERPGTLVP